MTDQPHKLYQCQNANCAGPQGKPHRFLAAEPRCPKCGISADHPRFGSVIGRLVMIHFDPPAEVPGFGMGHRACRPDVASTVPTDAVGRPLVTVQATGDPTAVTCPDCQRTDAFHAAVRALAHEDDDAALRGAMNRIQTAAATGR